MGFVELGSALGRRRRTIAVIAGVGAAAAALLTGIAVELEHGLGSARDALRTARPSGTITVVEIDAASLTAFDRWPWPRSVHARLVDQANRLGAASIAFDVDLSARSAPAEDARLARSLAASKAHIILPTFRQSAGGGRRGEIESLPAEPFRPHAMLAAVNVRPDADGIVRRLPVGVVTAAVPRPSLPALVAGTAGRAGESFPIDYGLDPRRLPRLSFADLVAGRVDPALVRGRDLIVGATAIEMGDRYLVPGYGVIPGVLIQALGAETLRARGVPVELGALPALLLVALLAGLAMRGGRRRRWQISLLAAVLPIAAAFALEAAGPYRITVAPALILLLAGGAAFAGAGHLHRLALDRLRDRPTGLGNGAALARSAGTVAGIGVAAIPNFRALAALLGPGQLDELILRMAERLAVGTAASLYRIDEGSLAWVADADGEHAPEDGFAGLQAVVRAPFYLSGRAVDVPVAFGHARGPGAPALLAGRALAAAQDAGTRGVRFAAHDGRDSADAEWDLTILSELDAAMADGSLWVAYQPKLSLESGRIAGAEALVRWLHPVRGAIPPDRFVPIVEARGRMMAMTMHVLDRALADAVRLAAEGAPLSIAVNLSTTLLAEPGLTDRIADAVARVGATPAMLTIEITESAAVDLSEDTIAVIERLRATGIRISVDDYGTGQSTLSYLKRFPAHEVKIDKSFVQTMRSSASDRILVRSTIEMAHELGLAVVAEGVEDEETLAALRDMGCDSIQGYHVGRPMRIDDLAARLRPPAPAADLAA